MINMNKDEVKAHSELCPVCKGSGKYRHVSDGLSSYTYYETQCHGCGGKGWIVIIDNEKPDLGTLWDNTIY